MGTVAVILMRNISNGPCNATDSEFRFSIWEFGIKELLSEPFSTTSHYEKLEPFIIISTVV